MPCTLVLLPVLCVLCGLTAVFRIKPDLLFCLAQSDSIILEGAAQPAKTAGKPHGFYARE